MTPMQNARMAVAGVAIALGILAGCSHSAFKPNDIGENGKPIWTRQSVSLQILNFLDPRTLRVTLDPPWPLLG